MALFFNVLLIAFHHDKSSWIIPDSGVEPNESTIDVAHRELYEKADVKGRILQELDVFENREIKY